MMKKINANRIMLGDYFLVGDEDKRYMYVASINDYAIMFDFKGNDELLFESKEEYIEPIHITSELLEKIGCLKGYDTLIYEPVYSISISEYHIEINKLSNTRNKTWSVHIENEDYETIGSLDVEYLHELQHIIRDTTDKELEIEL